MSDYLSRLIEHGSGGQTAIVRPRQPQPFERQRLDSSLLPSVELGDPVLAGVQADSAASAALAERQALTPSVRVGKASDPAASTRPASATTVQSISLSPAEPAIALPRLKPDQASLQKHSRKGDLAQLASPSEGSPAPIIRVTIGRIEVRAAQPATPPAAGKPAAQKPSLTLDEYLASRRASQP